jgi:hypothetical protein
VARSIVCTAVCESLACPFNLRHVIDAGPWECALPAERALEVLVELVATIAAPPLVSAGSSAR